MANDDVQQPLVTTLLGPSPQPWPNNSVKRRGLHHCKSAPVDSKSAPVDSIALKNNEVTLPPLSDNIITNLGFKQVGLLLVIYLAVASICFYFVQDQIAGIKTNGLLDAVYFCIVTMTTVGYGDLVPDSVASKLLACVFVFTGMAFVGLILSNSADYLIEKQESLLVRALHMNETICEDEILKEIQSNKVKYKFVSSFILLVVLIFVGTVFLYEVEKLSFVDSFYCVCSTITTLGYGDKSFSSEAGRIFAIFWILTSTICLAQFYLYIAELNTDKRQKSLVKWVLSRKMTTTDLEAADLDNDRSVSAAEFILYKLKEMGKISREDITLLTEEFEQLDVDQSGTLSHSDIMLANGS